MVGSKTPYHLDVLFCFSATTRGSQRNTLITLRKTLPIVLLLFAFAFSAGAQQSDSQANSSLTLHAQANLVLVDVVVTDAEHRPVLGLKREQFSLSEGRTPQVIKSFEEHTAPNGSELSKFAGLPKLPPGVFTNYVPAPKDGSAVNVLLLDALNTPLSDQQYVRMQLLDFVKNQKPGTSIAVFGLSRQLVMLQGFTSNPELLKQVLKKQDGQGSILLDDPVGSSGASDASSDVVADSQQPASSGLLNSPSLPAGDVVANLKTFEDNVSSFQTMVRIRYTLDAMNDLARYLASIPGRKNLIWFSGSFPLNILPAGDGSADAFAAVVDAGDEYRDTVHLLTRAQVAVYPVDARGLQVVPMFSATQKGGRYAANPLNFNKDQQKFSAANAAEHETMNVMAEDTGGRAFYNTNGLSSAVSEAIDNGSHYYTLAYTPSDAKENSDFHKIDVKLLPAGYTLNYRRGYFADNAKSPKVALASKPESSALDPASPEVKLRKGLLQKAMHHGVPGSTEIIYSLRVLPDAAPEITEQTLAPNNVANKPGFLPIRPPYRVFRADFGTDPSNIVFTKGADNLFHASLVFVTFIYQPNGQVVNSVSNQIDLNLTAARYAGLLHNGGITFTQRVSAPAEGNYSLRTGILDLTSSRIGATEVPLSLVRNLGPLPVQPQRTAK